MDLVSEVDYLSARSTREFQLAQEAVSPAIARPHYMIALAYLEQAEELKRQLATSSRGSVSV